MSYKDNEKRLENNRRWRERNREAIRAQQRAWYEANRDAINERRRANAKQRWATDPEFRAKESARIKRLRTENKLLDQWGVDDLLQGPEPLTAPSDGQALPGDESAGEGPASGWPASA